MSVRSEVNANIPVPLLPELVPPLATYTHPKYGLPGLLLTAIPRGVPKEILGLLVEIVPLPTCLIRTWNVPGAMPRLVTIRPRLKATVPGVCRLLVTVPPLEMTQIASLVVVV